VLRAHAARDLPQMLSFPRYVAADRPAIGAECASRTSGVGLHADFAELETLSES